MSKTIVFDPPKEFIDKTVKGIADKHPDSMIVLAPFAGNISTHAPTKTGKYKGYHRMKLEILIPEEAIKGEDALNDFGAFAVLRLPIGYRIT
ncbi:hypothetical protein [Paenibacillus sp. DMB20]|uniref:hypothetical protein n=1 Tax=Paenibacillus sp. DMB20 TaxID=1642570 RepID=UPI0006274DEE|nr:hypothetical protein [Paenibacillus sp. DMB20]KKO51117.1 hypothetical protein XI25_29465 [Paenibacillus sp. DMB20]